MRRVRLRAATLVGGAIVAALVLCALLAPWLAPRDPAATVLADMLCEPTQGHPLGCDEAGADVASVLVYGARAALLVGVATVLLSACVGGAIGAASGYAGGRVDAVVMRLVDVVMAFPGLLLTIAIVAVTQRPSAATVVCALAVTGWVGYARVVRAQVLSLREREFVVAARSMGVRPVTIVLRHLVPNLLPVVVVQASFGMAGAVLAESALAFLGLGAQGLHSWGALLDQGASYMLLPGTRHLVVWPGACVALTVLGFNLLGDALRDALDPRARAGRPTAPS